MRIRNSVLVVVLSLGIPAALVSEPAYGQATQATAQELYNSGLELYKAGELKRAQETLRKVDPLQLPRELQPTFYNTLFEIDQKLNVPAQPETKTEEPTTPEVAQPPKPLPKPEPTAAKPDDATLLRQADAMTGSSPAQALAIYQQVAASENATDGQKAIAQARIAGIERQLNGDVTSVRKLIALAEADIVNNDLSAAESKLSSVKSSGVELGFFDSESVNKKLALINQVRQARAAALQAEEAAKQQPQAVAQAPKNEKPESQAPQGKELEAALARAAQAEQDKTAAEAQLAALQRRLAEQEANQVAQGPPVSDLMAQARNNTAAQKVEQGDKALRNGQLDAAVKLYEDATLLAPDNQAYADKLAAARAQLNDQVRPIRILDKTAEDLTVDRSRAIAEYEESMEAANGALNNQDFQQADDAVNEARVILSKNRNVFEAAEFKERDDRANRLQSEIQSTRARAKATELQRIEEARHEIEEQIAADAEKRKAAEIQERLRNARALQMEQNYEQAIAELEAALFLDPSNPVIQGLLEYLQDASIATESLRLSRQRDLSIADQSLLNIEATTPYSDILTYPGEWPELTYLRLRGLDNDAGESDANRAAQAALRKIVTLSNDNLSLDQVIAFIRDTTGANIAVNWPALELVSIDQDSLVTISLSRVPAQQLLRLVLDQVSADAFDDDKAGFTISEGIVKISTLRDLKTETETRVYDIRDLLVQVPNFTSAPGFDLNDALSNTNSGGSNGSGGGGGGGGESSLFGDGEEDAEDVPTRDELVDQINELITTTVGDPDEWLDEESTLTELNGNMIIKTTADNHRQIVGLLSRLRETRAVQISVEARFLSVEKNFLEEFRVDLDVTLNRDNVDANNDGVPDNGAKTLPITIGSNSFGLAARQSTLLNSALSAGVGNGINFGYSFVDDISVDLLLNATQGTSRTIGLTAPRITFFNGQRAYTLVATQTAFVSDLEPIPDSLGFDPTISVVTTGVVLDVEGTISSDRRYVTMTLRPSLATLISLEDFAIGGGGVVGDNVPVVITISGTIQVPTIQITQIRNTVSVPDRGTLLVGGQRLVGEVQTEIGVPILSKIPVINRLFTQNNLVDDERTLLILIRPTIIIQSEQEEVLFPGLNDDPEGYNVGNFNP